MRELTCIVCPNGCRLTIEEEARGPEEKHGAAAGRKPIAIRVSGNLCTKGEAFAIQEATDPRRSVTTTCRTAFAGIPVVPVKTDGEVRKDMMKQVVAEVNRITIREPMKIGDTVIKNVAGTGVDVVLCTNRLEECGRLHQCSTPDEEDLEGRKDG